MKLELNRDQLLNVIFNECFDFNKHVPYKEIMNETLDTDLFYAENVKVIGDGTYVLKFSNREMGIIYVGMEYSTMEMYAKKIDF